MSRLVKSACCASLILSALECTAQELVVSSEHEYFDWVLRAGDLAYQKAVFTSLTDRFEGIEKLEITQANSWKNADKALQFFGFPNSKIETDHGDIEAEIMRIIDQMDNNLLEVSYQFSPGLAGMKYGPPEGTGVSMFVAAINKTATSFLE